MRVFKSLNCILCKKPFVPIANQPRSPRRLLCGLAMCHECFEKEKSLGKDERKHQCVYNADQCFLNTNFAFYLIDLMSQDSLVLSPILGGYLLQKPFRPECPICQDEYSDKVDNKKSFIFLCNHIICHECHLSVLQANNDAATKVTWKYIVTCPICGKFAFSTGANAWANRLKDFLNELPEMTRQLEEMDKTGYRFCEECKGLDVVDRMFRCNGCVLKLCGTCTHRRHRSHETMTLLENEVNQMSEKLRCVSFDEINKSVFPVLHNELINDIHLFEEKFINQVDTLTTVVTYEGLQKDHKECMKLKTDFEACSEEYMRELLKYDAKIKGLIRTLERGKNQDW